LFCSNSSGSVQQIQKIFDISPWTWEDLRTRFVSEGIVPKLILRREGEIIQDTAENANWVKIPNDLSRSAILIPLLGRHEVLGILTLTHEQPGFFKSDQLNLLQAMASQAAIAVENAQLYATERKRVSELVALNQLTHRSSRIHIPQLFDQILTLSPTTSAINLVFWMKEDGGQNCSRLLVKRVSRRSLISTATSWECRTPAVFWPIMKNWNH
jgi:hypothetical protein